MQTTNAYKVEMKNVSFTFSFSASLEGEESNKSEFESPEREQRLLVFLDPLRRPKRASTLSSHALAMHKDAYILEPECHAVAGNVVSVLSACRPTLSEHQAIKHFGKVAAKDTRCKIISVIFRGESPQLKRQTNQTHRYK
ncbi:hypothetical protein HN011_012087 [Eciton burchellii]|nr:hypothetical protein HN011_012087 [Eciton burchellii]